MSRGLTGPQLAAAAAPHRINVPLIEAFFASGTVRFAMCSWEIAVGSDTYIATGAVLKIGDISESVRSQEGLQFTLSGLDAAIIDLLDPVEYLGKIVVIRKARLNVTTRALIDAPTIEWIGRMRNMRVNQAGTTYEVVVDAEHFEIELTRPAPRRWSNADQQRLYAGDKACEYAATMTEKYVPFPSREFLRK